MHRPLSTERGLLNATFETDVRRTDFFIIGNSKSGTSALFEFLGQHPDVCTCEPKEPNVFATDLLHDEPVGAFQRKSLDAYHDMFDDPTGKKLRGEASACYLYSTEAARNLYAYNPDAKLIAILREPVDFLHSYHLQQRKNPISEGDDVRDFETALALEPARRRGQSLPDGCLVPELLYYSERVRYAEHLQRVYDVFPAEQVKVYVYEDFKRDNAAVFSDLVDFLGLNPDFEPRFGTHNPGKSVKSRSIHRWVHRLSHGTHGLGSLRHFIKSFVPTPVRKFLFRFVLRKMVFGPKTRIDPALRKTLQDRFAPDVRRFGRLIGRDMLSEWGYR